jgi:acylglycerol lipase
MSAVAGSFLQDVDARAVRAHHFLIVDVEKHPWVSHRSAITGNGAVVDVKSLRGETPGQSRVVSVAFRHFCPRSGGLRAVMIAMPRMHSTVLCAFAVTAFLLAACAGQLDPPGPAVTKAAETSGAFVMPDGMRLPYRVWLPTGAPRAVVLALHGMNDSRDAWEIPAPEFAAAGVAVYAPDQRGFGATTARGYWPGTEGLVADAREMSRLLHEHYPGVPEYMMGESMGAAVMMVMATEPHPPKVDGYVLIAPAVWGRAEMNIFMRGALWIAAKTVPGMLLENRGYVKITASDNHEALVRLSKDPLTILSTRVDTTKGLVDLMDAALASAPRFREQSLFLYGGKDDLIPKRATMATWRALPEGATLAYYPDHYHLAMRDLGRDTVIKDVVAWMKNPGAPLPSGADKAAEVWVRADE